MNNDVIITCAVTGAGDTTSRSHLVPITPRQVADAAIEAAQAGAAVVHVHVRDPETGAGSRDPSLFREAVDMIRDSGVDMIINLTAGMGGDWVPSEGDPSLPGPGTDMIGPEERLAHVVECKPDICSLDCGRSRRIMIVSARWFCASSSRSVRISSPSAMPSTLSEPTIK